MRIISGPDMDAVLDHRDLIETLRRAFRSEAIAPDPVRYRIERPDLDRGILKIDPAWTNFVEQGHVKRGYVGCTLSLALPRPPDRNGIAPVAAPGVYLLMSGTNGAPIALLDGTRLAAWRHVAVHALAASYLAREDAARLLVIGEHPLLPHLVPAYAAVRNIRSVLLLGSGDTTLRKLQGLPALSKVTIAATGDAPGALQGADMVCCVSASLGDLPMSTVSEGVHVDIISPQAEVQDDLTSLTRNFVSDRRDAAILGPAEIAADLREIAQGEKAGRRFYGQRTLFKSGDSTGLVDLAAAGHVFLRS